MLELHRVLYVLAVGALPVLVMLVMIAGFRFANAVSLLTKAEYVDLKRHALGTAAKFLIVIVPGVTAGLVWPLFPSDPEGWALIASIVSLVNVLLVGGLVGWVAHLKLLHTFSMHEKGKCG